MSRRQIITTWLWFGLGLGVLSATNIMLATGGDLFGGLVGIAIGLTIGVVGGILRLIYLNHSALIPASNLRGSWTMAVSAVTLVVIGSFVRAAGGPALVYLSLLGVSVVILLILLLIRVQRH
jgi:hypothetical protein